MDLLSAGDATLRYNKSESKLLFDGSMRLANMKEYGVVTEFLDKSAEVSDGHLTLDFRSLEFLNSSGITTMSLFILKCKNSGKPHITILSDNSVPWQQKSINNFKKLWNDVEIKM